MKLGQELAEREIKGEDLNVLEMSKLMITRGLNEHESKKCLEYMHKRVAWYSAEDGEAPLVALFREKFAGTKKKHWSSFTQEIDELNLTDEERQRLLESIQESFKE